MNKIDNFPLVSVIITGKNEEQYIGKCISSILKQNYVNFEIIFVDDRSDDSTIEIVDKLKKSQNLFPNCKRLEIISAEANSPAKGRNLGVKNSRGEIMAFTDADCVADIKWLKNMIDIMNTNKISVIGGPNVLSHHNDSKFVSTIDSVLGSYLGSGGSAQFLKISKLRNVSAIPACNMGIKKDIFQEINGFDESMRFNEDSDLCFRIKNKGYEIIYSPDVKVCHYMGIDSYENFRTILFKYGLERGKNLKKNSSLVTKFNIFSLCFSFIFFSFIIGSLFSNVLQWILLGTVFIIIAVILFESIKISIKEKSIFSMFVASFLFLSVFIIYNMGFLKGCFNNHE